MIEVIDGGFELANTESAKKRIRPVSYTHLDVYKRQLQYFKNEPVYRAYHHGTLTFSLLYAFSEKFLLPLSHDEVVHLKLSLIHI